MDKRIEELEPGMEIDKMSYEQAYGRLEEIVTALEQGEQNLEEALALYTQGQALARRCAELLENAELRVRQLVGDELLDLPAG